MEAGAARIEFKRLPLSEICRRIAGMGEEARTFIDDRWTLEEFMAILVKNGLHRDSVLVRAYVLTEQESLWWACRCLRQEGIPEANNSAEGAMRAAERWVSDPSEKLRLTAFRSAEIAGFGTPAGCLAFAVWCESEAAPDDIPGHPPKGQRTAPMVAKAILLAAVTDERGEMITEPDLMTQRLQEFLEIGTNVANGTDRWPDSPPHPETSRVPGS